MRVQYFRELKKKYGLTQPEYVEMFLRQEGKCYLCDRLPTPSLKRGITLVVDHDHKTGKVRKLLCTQCNVALGYFDDNPELLAKAITYVTGHQLFLPQGKISKGSLVHEKNGNWTVRYREIGIDGVKRNRSKLLGSAKRFPTEELAMAAKDEFMKGRKEKVMVERFLKQRADNAQASLSTSEVLSEQVMTAAYQEGTASPTTALDPTSTDNFQRPDKTSDQVLQ